MKPYTLIIVPMWWFTKNRPRILDTANWKLYTRGEQQYMVACVQTLEVSTIGGAYNVEQLHAYTCGQDDNSISWHPCDDYDAELDNTFHLVPDRVGVSPE